MNIYEAFETDAGELKDGKWLEIVFHGKVICEVRVRSASPDLNAELRKAMTDEAIGLIKEKGAAMSVHEALADEDLERKLFAHAVVSGWKGVTDRNGKALKCTPKNALRVFMDLPLLFKQVRQVAYRWESFRKATSEAALGNSKTSSGTKSAA